MNICNGDTIQIARPNKADDGSATTDYAGHFKATIPSSEVSQTPTPLRQSTTPAPKRPPTPQAVCGSSKMPPAPPPKRPKLSEAPDTVQERLQEAELSLQFKSKRLEELERTHKQCGERIMSLQDKVNNLEGAHSDGSLRAQQLQSAVDRLKNENASLRSQLTTAQQEREDVCSKLNEAEVALERLKKSLKSTTEQKVAAEKMTQETADTLAARTTKLAQTEASLKQKTEKTSSLTAEKAELMEKLAAAGSLQELLTQSLGSFFKSSSHLASEADRILQLVKGGVDVGCTQIEASQVEEHAIEAEWQEQPEEPLPPSLLEIPIASEPLPLMEDFDFGQAAVEILGLEDPCEFTFELCCVLCFLKTQTCFQKILVG